MGRLLLALVGLSAGCSVLVEVDGLADPAVAAPGGADAAASGGPGPEAGATDAGGDLPDGGSPADAGPAPPPDFVDAFDRPDGVVANDWIENEADVFSLSGGRVVAKSGNWLARYLYRPAAEDVRDVETSVELRWSTTPPKDCDATLLLRVKRANGKLWGYAAFIDDRTAVAVSRIDSSAEQFLGSRALSQPINTSDTYRLRFRVEGTMPVALVATFERSDGGTWTTLGTNTLTDDSGKRVVDPGSVGITSDVNATFSYDNFTRTAL